MTTVTNVAPVQPETKTKKSRKSPVTVAADVRKGWNNVSSISKGVGSGVVKGSATGLGAFLGLWAIDVLKNVNNAQAQKSLWTDFAKPIGSAIGKGVRAIPSTVGKLFKQNFGTTLKKVFVDTPNKVWKAFKGTKNISTPAKVGVALLSLGVTTWSVFKSKLNANEKNADVDHRWRTGHDSRESK